MTHGKEPSDFFPASDDLSSMVEAPVAEQPDSMGRLPSSNHSKVDREAFGVNREHAHKEACPKCRGSGRFISWAGRDCGKCNACKGEGFKYFVHSAEMRAKNREQVAARKERTAQEAVERFQADFPDVWAWMFGNTFPVAVDMMTRLVKYGSLSGNTIAAARRMIEQREHTIMGLRTTQTELATQIGFLQRHMPNHPQMDATRRRLADVAAEIVAIEESIVELRQIGAK